MSTAVGKFFSWLDPTRTDKGSLRGGVEAGLSYIDPTKKTNSLRGDLTRGYENLSGATAARNAAKAQEAALGEAGTQVNKYYDQAEGYQQPFYDQGVQDYMRLGDMVRGGEFDMQQPQAYSGPAAPEYGPAPSEYQDKGFNFQADPGYQFRMDQGTAALNTSAATRGSGLSGATLKALSRYGQGLASQEYANAYGRYQDQRNFGYGASRDRMADYNTNRDFLRGAYENDRNFGYQNYSDTYDRRNAANSDRYDRLAGLANVGTNAAANLGTMAMGRGNTMADLAIQRGNAQAAGIVGPGNANRGMFKDLLGAAIPLTGMFMGNRGSSPRDVAERTFNKQYGKLPY